MYNGDRARKEALVSYGFRQRQRKKAPEREAARRFKLAPRKPREKIHAA